MSTFKTPQKLKPELKETKQFVEEFLGTHGNCDSFLRVGDSNTELFKFLADAAVEIHTEKIIVTSRGNLIITNGNNNVSFMLLKRGNLFLWVGSNNDFFFPIKRSFTNDVNFYSLSFSIMLIELITFGSTM